MAVMDFSLLLELLEVFVSCLSDKDFIVLQTRLQVQAAGVGYSHPLSNLTSRMAFFGPQMVCLLTFVVVICYDFIFFCRLMIRDFELYPVHLFHGHFVHSILCFWRRKNLFEIPSYL